MNGRTHAPHRLFFVAAGVQLLLASAWWGWAVAARAYGMPPPLAGDLDPVRVHAFLMLYTFLPLFAFGYLAKYAPCPAGATAVVPGDGMVRAAVAFAASTLVYPALVLGARALAAVVLAMFIAWAWNLVCLVQLLETSEARARGAIAASTAALGAGALGLAAMGLDLSTRWDWPGNAMETLGLWAFALPLFLILSRGTMPGRESARTDPGAWWPLTVMIAASLVHGMLVLFDASEWTWAVDAPLAFALAAGTIGTQPRTRIGRDARVMLQFATAWLAVAFALFTAQSALRAVGFGVLGLAPLHALTAGYLASAALALIGRSESEAASRRAGTDRPAWNAFLLLQAAAVARVAADLWPAHSRTLLLEAAALWLACFAVWGWRYLPTYSPPRTHGRTG